MKSFNIEDKKTTLMVITALAWILITILGWLDIWYPAMLLGVLLMVIYMILGCSKKGAVSTEFFKFPIVVFAALWVVAFTLIYYWDTAYAGIIPDFTILGMHPSFAAQVILYWIGGFVILAFGFSSRSNLWLTREEWDKFLEEIESEKDSKGGTESGS